VVMPTRKGMGVYSPQWESVYLLSEQHGARATSLKNGVLYRAFKMEITIYLKQDGVCILILGRPAKAAYVCLFLLF
jgi:hypothetical protein